MHGHGHGEGEVVDGGPVAAVADGHTTDSFGAQIGEYFHTIGWADYGCYIGLLLIIAGVTLVNVRRSNLIPLRDPRLSESLNFENF